jgi:hypothetical protein
MTVGQFKLKELLGEYWEIVHVSYWSTDKMNKTSEKEVLLKL